MTHPPPSAAGDYAHTKGFVTVIIKKVKMKRKLKYMSETIDTADGFSGKHYAISRRFGHIIKNERSDM